MASSYDEKLLAATSNVTRADLQDGYDPDLLADESNLGHRQPTLRYTNLSPLRSDSHASSPLDGKERDLESAIPLQTDADHQQSPDRLESSIKGTRPMPFVNTTNTTTTATKKAVPFWRTRKGIAILVVIAVVVIALAAGLGGGLGSKKSGGTSSNSNDTANGAQDSGQGVSQGVETQAASGTTIATNTPSAAVTFSAPIGPASTASPGINQTSEAGQDTNHQGPDDPVGTTGDAQDAGAVQPGASNTP